MRSIAQPYTVYSVPSRKRLGRRCGPGFFPRILEQ